MKMKAICFAILTLREYVWSLLMNILYPTLRQLVQNYPTLFCILSNTRLTFIPIAMVFILLLIIKAFLVLFPHHFFNLNMHERGTAACILLILSALVLELSFSLGLNGHYCHTQYFLRLKNQLELQVDAFTMEIFPWLQILIIVAVLTELIVNALLQFRAWKQRRNVAPAPMPLVFIVSTNDESKIQEPVDNGRLNIQAPMANNRSNFQARKANNRSNFQLPIANQSSIQAPVANCRSNIQDTVANSRSNIQAPVANNQLNIQAPVGLPLNPQSQTYREVKLTLKCSVICGLLRMISGFMERLLSSNEDYYNLFINVHIIFGQVTRNLLPLVWLTSSDEIIDFAFRSLKDKILLCPQVIQNMVSRFINLENQIKANLRFR